MNVRKNTQTSVVRQMYAAAASEMPQPPDLLPEPANALRRKLDELVIGQEEAKEAICAVDHLTCTGLHPDGRPAGVIFLLGPTGCGKTQLVESYAQAKHGSPKNLLVINCGEYQERHEVAKLGGAPPGYLGHRETTPVFSQARINSVTSERSSFSIVLFDEFEKAHPDFQNIILAILDKGIFRTGDNNTVNFERTIIFFTSNCGSAEINKRLDVAAHLGFPTSTDSSEALTGNVKSSARRALDKLVKPEFMNRLDEVVVCHPLTRPQCRQIVDIKLQQLSDFIDNRHGIRAPELYVTNEAREELVTLGFDARYGGRSLNRVIQKQVLLPIARFFSTVNMSPHLLTFTRAENGGGLKMAVEKLGQHAKVGELLRRVNPLCKTQP